MRSSQAVQRDLDQGALTQFRPRRKRKEERGRRLLIARKVPNEKFPTKGTLAGPESLRTKANR